jgi:hypothetical protein
MYRIKSLLSGAARVVITMHTYTKGPPRPVEGWAQGAGRGTFSVRSCDSDGHGVEGGALFGVTSVIRVCACVRARVFFFSVPVPCKWNIMIRCNNTAATWIGFSSMTRAAAGTGTGHFETYIVFGILGSEIVARHTTPRETAYRNDTVAVLRWRLGGPSPSPLKPCKN